MAVKAVSYTCKTKGVTTNLNVRKNPNATSSIIAKIPGGTKNIKVTRIDGVWYYIADKKGWSHSKYLEVTNKKSTDSSSTIHKLQSDQIKEVNTTKNKTTSKKNTTSESDLNTSSGKSNDSYIGNGNDRILADLVDKNMGSLKKIIIDHGLAFSPATADWFNKFNRIGLVDPYNTLIGNTKEYLFFVKPDLNLVRVSNGHKGKLIAAIQNDPFFMDLATNHPDVIKMLQYSYDHKPFCTFLTSSVKSTIPIQNIEAETVETATNIYGTSIEYRGDGHKSDENISFSLEFGDDKDLEVYMFFKAYERYEQLKKKGLIGPKYQSYRECKILHDVMGIYKIVVGEDMQTIVYWAYYWGVMPMNVPRDAFSEIDPGKVITYNIDFKAAFVDDMDPMILRDFNILADMQYKNRDTKIPVYDKVNERVDGRWAKCPYIKVNVLNKKHIYKLVWYK